MRNLNMRVMSKILDRAVILAVTPAVIGFGSVIAHAQDSDEAAAASAEDTASRIVVTGTRIRGVAPVGSDLIQLDQEALSRTGQLSTADILAKVPAVLTLGTGDSYSGGASQSTNDLNALSFNKSPNLRGFGPQATLSLVNGHRVPYDGANMNTFDGDNIPVQMLQRIEIVADGTSATYGADAVAGTVNYIMRQPFTGVELYGQYGLADGQDRYQLTGVGGWDWGSGGIVVAYQRTHSDRLRASSRPTLYNDDYSAFGGPGSSIQSSPGNIVYNGQTYAIPAGQDGTSLTLAQIGAAGTANRQNVWTGYDAIPEFERDNYAVNFTQELGSGIRIYADGFYSDREFDISFYQTSVNSRNTLTIPNSNFYSPCNRSLAGAPAALLAACGTGSLTVAYNNVYDAGPAKRSGYTKTWDATFGAEVALFADWSVNGNASFGRNRASSVNTLYFGNGLGFLPALGGTTASTAFNPFCDGSAFDCGNGQFADDITRPAPFPFGSTLNVDTTFDVNLYSLNADGTLFSLPGGDVRLAIGAEHQELMFINGNNFATTINKRKINSAFGEVYVPVIGQDNAMPGVQELELTAAIRLDDYNDVGNSVNPKIGLNWAPTEWLKMRASYGTSFRAPGLVDNDPNSQAGHLPNFFAGSVIDASLCPTCAGTPQITIFQALGGAAGTLRPEESTSWSAGLEIAPPSSGARFGLTYWNIKYTGQVGTPVYNVGAYQAINQGYYDAEIIFNPAYFPGKAASNPVAFFGPYPYDSGNPACAAVAGQNITSQTLFDQLVTCINTNGTSPVLGPPGTNVVAIDNGHRLNAGSTHSDGLDISGSYDWSMGSSDMHVGFIASYIFNWNVSPIPTAPVTDQVNHFGYPLRLRGRADASWTSDVGPGSMTLAGYLNYANAYNIDQVLLPAGVSSDYTDISAYTTVDLAVHYSFGEDAGTWLDGLSLSISAQNVFDNLPPLVLNSGSTAGIMFDPSNGSPLGRVVQFQIAKKF